MKKLLLTVLLSLNLSSAHANEKTPFTWEGKEVQCGPVEELLLNIKKWGETPLFISDSTYLNSNGVGKHILVYLFINDKEQTFTLVEVVNQETACIVSVGHNLRFLKEFVGEGIKL